MSLGIIKDRFALSLTAGFTLVAAWAWADAVQSLFSGPCGEPGAGPLCHMQSYGRFIYAICITLFSLLVTYLMSRVSKQVEFQRAQERQLEWQKALGELQKAQTI